MSEAKSGYVPAPEVGKESEERYKAVLLTIAGELSVTDGAKRLGISRVRYQTLVHRALRGLIQEVTKKPPGRKPKPEREQTLEQEVERLRKENEKLQKESHESVMLLGAASILLQKQMGMRPRYKNRRKAAATEPGEGPASEDPAGTARWILQVAPLLAERLGSPELAAVALNVGASTVRRFAQRQREGELLVNRRGPGPKHPAPAMARKRVEILVRKSEGLLGAEVLRRRVPEVSRREAALIKAETETAMERERKAEATRVLIAAAGVLRGFDSMQVNTENGARHLLACTDGCVPYRTSARLVERYNGHAVATILDDDFTQNGAPYILRDDRAAQH
jgi:transposase